MNKMNQTTKNTKKSAVADNWESQNDTIRPVLTATISSSKPSNLVKQKIRAKRELFENRVWFRCSGLSTYYQYSKYKKFVKGSICE